MEDLYSSFVESRLTCRVCCLAGDYSRPMWRVGSNNAGAFCGSRWDGTGLLSCGLSLGRDRTAWKNCAEKAGQLRGVVLSAS
jgi:hypothetical protein